MADKLGMNPSIVRGASQTIEGQLELIEHAQGQLTLAVAMSQNPLSYLLSPGALILAPFSISQMAMANAELILARGSARELVAKLLQEVEAQEFASGRQDSSYETGYAWRTPDSKSVPDLDPWDFIGGPVNVLKNLADTVGTVAGYVDTGLEWLKKYGPDAMAKVTKFWDELPPWAKSLKKFGRALPWVGTAVSAVDLSVAWSKGDAWGVTRSIISIGLDVASVAATGTIVGAPAGLVLAGVGIVFDLAADAGERYVNQITHAEEMGQYYIENPWMAAVHVVAPITLDWWGPIAK
jgi:hypothetical protein